MNMQKKWVHLKTFIYPTDAYPLVGRLETEGIECFLQDESTVGLYGGLVNAVGGVKLKVQEEDLERALKIMEDGEKK